MERFPRLSLQALMVFALVIGITILQYLTANPSHRLHVLYRGLYFIPVTLAGFWWGIRGALPTSIGITLLYIPLVWIHWHALSAFDVDKVVEISLYNFVSLVIGVLRDRERKEELRAREAQSLAAVGKAVSALAHDMKTPLIAIGGFSRMVKRHLREDHPHRDKLDIIIVETMRLENMVKDMLDFSRPLDLRMMLVDMALLLAECNRIVDDVAKERNVQIESHTSPDSFLIQVDPMRMKQAVINLLVNSIQASPEGEIVTISCYKKGVDCIVDVSDCGCGIPLEKREEIFTPFFTTKKEGTGLGLPIVRKIIEAHRGNVQILDNPGRGVTFRVIIPANISEDG